MKWTTHLNRLAAERLGMSGKIKDVALISISDPASEHPRLKGWPHILRLRFHDIGTTPESTPSTLYHNWVFPAKEHADAIVAFIREHQHRAIIAHCEAGISRSAAVCALLEHLGWEYDPPTKFGHSLANPLLKRLLWESAGTFIGEIPASEQRSE